MAETPPSQVVAEPQTPPTPRHGAAYDTLNSPLRRSKRLLQRNTTRDRQATPEVHTTTRPGRGLGTPGSSRRTSPNSLSGLHSPRLSPKRKATRRVEVMSPSSSDLPPARPTKPSQSKSHRSLFASSTTIMSEGMLPTPVKTPKQKALPQMSGARVLFQDQPAIGDGVFPSPRKGRKNKRYNGFSLESFHADEEDGRGPIEIFTDSRDRVPQVDESENNPFVDQPARSVAISRSATGPSKRRKISIENRKDTQVEDAISKDEGMVYVFRGKKVYRKFDDADEEEEVIDTEDLGLLNRTPNGRDAVRPLTTLTRKSIKPRRLFETEQQKLTRELEKEEEVTTEVEDDDAPEVIDVPLLLDEKPSPEKQPRSGSKIIVSQAESIAPSASSAPKSAKRKVNSPFDSWKRVKAGSSGSNDPLSRGKKRAAAEALEAGKPSDKRVKAD